MERHLSRRTVLAGTAGLAGLAVAGGLGLRRWSRAALSFTPLAAPRGFRELAGGAVSVASDPLLGLDEEDDGPPGLPGRGKDLCDALFRGAGPEGPVRVAYFSDYRCPYCRVLTPRLIERERAGGIRLVWHEWPVFGPASVQAARAMAAAGELGAPAAIHRRLAGTSFRPTRAYLRQVAQDVGLSPARLLDRMEGDGVRRALAASAALAGRFGFAGVPAMVVGRTVVTGEIAARRLDRLIAAEGAAPPGPCG